MPARCPTCGEEALTETARFCIGCGGPLPEADIDTVLAELADAVVADPEPDDNPALQLPQLRAEPEPEPAPPPTPPREDVPAFTPRPVPSRAAAPAARPPAPASPPAKTPHHRQPPFPPLRDSAPIVPLPLVVAGVIGVLALLLILLLAA